MTKPANESANIPAGKPPRRRSSAGIIVLLLILIIIGAPVLAVGVVAWPGPLTEKKTIVIPHGTSTADIAALLENNGVIVNRLAFRGASRLLANGALQAGEYEFTPGQSIADVIITIHEGHSVVRMFTVPEGLTSAEIVDLLKNNPVLTGDVAQVPAEGSLLPETYRYSYGDARAGIVARMQKGMQDAINEAWTQRDAAIPLKSPQEAVILASIVEKETGKPEERPRIAQVFYNRLKISMRLQSDPTVIYALTQGKGPLDRPLTRDDLMFPSPYSTYTSDGLPPHPICNPGRAALTAVLHPEPGDFLYFVADGTGGHVFAKDLAGHNQNVAKWERTKAGAPPAAPMPPVKPAAR